jgi:simple sugar transport system permease protein
MSKLIDEVKDSRRKYDVGSWIVPIIAVLTAMLVASVLMLIQGLDPMLAYKSLFTTAFGSSEGIAATLGKATPLVLSGLAVTLGLRAGLFNIGVQGQLLKSI